MALEFRLPDIGEGIAEGEITTWLVREGQEVAEDEPMVEVMTDKATVEITSPRSGRILKILVEEGTTVAIGTGIVIIGDEGETGPEEAERFEAAASTPAAGPAPAVPEAPAGGTGSGGPASGGPAPSGPVPGAAAGGRPGGRALAAPAVRRLAREMGVEIDRVHASGPGGRVLASDLEAFAGGGSGAPARPERAPAGRPSGGQERFKLKGIRKLISERLSESVHRAVHVTHVDEVDTSALDALIEAGALRAEESGVRLTYLPFIVRALVATLREFPMFNATLDEEAGEIVYRYDYHIGVAVASDRGLLVPVVRDADNLSVLELAAEIRRKATATRDNTIGPEDLSGSTITITNFGAIGGLFATPVINYPEAAILGVGASRQRPVVRDGQIVARPMMYLSITFDHRITDGAEGARFMNMLKNYLEHPALIFMEW